MSLTVVLLLVLAAALGAATWALATGRLRGELAPPARYAMAGTLVLPPPVPGQAPAGAAPPGTPPGPSSATAQAGPPQPAPGPAGDPDGDPGTGR